MWRGWVSDGRVELEFFQFKPEAIQAFDEVIAGFEAENPGIHVVQNAVPDAGTAIRTRLVRNDVPDVMTLNGDFSFGELSGAGVFYDFADEPVLDEVNPAIVEILQKEGFVNSITESKDGPQGVISLTLRWDGQHRSAISGLRRVSTPGQRRYVGADSLPKVRGGMGTAIVSTSKGIMTDRQARKENVGGEVICEVW